MMNHRRERLLYQASDYDIREVDEDLYLAVLARRRAKDACSASGLSDSGESTQGPARTSKGQEIG